MMQEQEVLAAPYKGDKPYIFISYSHKDRDEAVKVIRLLQQNRYRVWYDEGIDPGTEWDDNIAGHINQCEYFLALISPNSVTSSNCKDEIKYAMDLDKPRALVYLTDTQLPAAMQMRLGRLQAVYKYKYNSEDTFIQKLLEAKGIEACCEEEDKILDWMKEKFDLNGIVNGIVGDSSEQDENLENLEVSVLKLESEDGTRSQDVRCEILDQIEYKNNQYLILVPVDENGEELLDSGEVLIALVKDPGNGEQKRYFGFEDEELADQVFELFLNRKKDEFNFEDAITEILAEYDKLHSEAENEVEWKFFKVVAGIVMYMIGFCAYFDMICRVSIRRFYRLESWIGLVIIIIALSALWFNVRNIQNVLPLAKNKKKGWQILGCIVWSLVIIAVVTIVEGIIFTID